MREILFRGKRLDNGEWVKGYYIKATHHWHNNGIHEDWIAVDTIQNGGWCNVRGKYAVIPETVGQYTGLTDKNGKKIFEGDIVIHPSGTFVVKFLQGSFCFGLNDLYPKHTRSEVIGNIHDNPELLRNDGADDC